MSEKFLLVDDQTSILQVVGRFLKILGYEYDTASDGQEALGKLKKNPYAVLISDFQMPRMSGLELVKHARIHDPNMGVIILTGVGDLTTAVELMKAGANEYLLKPVQFDTLNISIEKCLDYRRLHLELESHRRELEEKVQQRTMQLTNALTEVQAAHAEVQQAHFDLIMVLAKAAESNDTDTGYHIRRVSAYVATIAEEINLDIEEAEMLGRLSTVHDIGKVTIHPDILRKPGKLTEEEFEAMKLHTVRGAEILNQSTSLTKAVNIARSHHERYDGKGYPDRIEGEDIPIEARITSIADVFDALTMRRCYKEPWPTDKAFQLIQEERGKQFDPTLVDAFMKSSDKITAIREQFSD